MKKVLVITAKSDIHCHFVGLEIKKQGGDILRINTEKSSSKKSQENNNAFKLLFLAFFASQ